MLQNYNAYKILELFFDFPTKNFQLREISRLVGLGLPSVIAHIKKLEKEEFVKKEKANIYYSYKANKTTKFKIYKKTNLILRLNESGLIKFLEETFLPSVIILFGSASRGEDIESSDIDLFILAKEKKVDLKIFEKKLKRKVSLLFEETVGDVPKELMNNIINGVVLSGYLKVLK